MLQAARAAAGALLCVLALGTAPDLVSAQERAQEPPARTTEQAKGGDAFRIGVVQRGDVAELLDKLRPMARDLERLLGQPVEILPMASYSALADAHALGRVDLAFYATLAYLAADAACGCIEPLVAPAAANGDAALASLLMVRRDAGPRTLDELRGGRLAVGPQQALATWIWPQAQLASEGIDLEAMAGELHRIDSPVDALGLLASGRVDAALVWGTASTALDRDLPRGPLGQAQQAGVIGGSEFTVLWRSQPLPHGPVAVRASADRELKTKLRQFLVDLDELSPDIYDRLDRFYGGGFVVVDRRDYRGLRSLMLDRP